MTRRLRRAAFCALLGALVCAFPYLLDRASVAAWLSHRRPL